MFDLLQVKLLNLLFTEDVVLLVKGFIGEEFVFDTPFSGEEFGDVVSDRVTENTDNPLGCIILPSLGFNILKSSLNH